MAVLKDNVASTSGTSVTSLTLSSFAVASQPNRCLFALAGTADAAGGGTMSNWAWNTSETITEMTDVAQGSFHRIGCAFLLNPTATTASVTVSFSGSEDEAFLAAYAAYNVDQTTPHGTVQTALAPASGTAWVACEGVANGISLGFFWGNGTAIAVNDGIPEYIAVGTATSSAGATSLSPTSAPAGRLLGDIEFCSIATENNEAISESSGSWTKLGSTVQQNATWQEEIWYRLYDGSNVNPSFSWTSSVGCSARRWLFRDNATSGTLFGFHATNSGSTSTHSITGQNATGNDSTVMYLSHAEANTALGADAGYSERFDAGSATGPYRLTVGNRDQPTSGAGADNFSATGASASWVMRLIEIFNSHSGDQTQETEIENIAGFDSAAIASEPGDTYNTFGWTVTGINGNGGALAFSINPAAPAVDLFLPPLVMAPHRPGSYAGR